MLSENVSSADNQQERVLSSTSENLKWYLAGFADGEGCFSVAVCKHKCAKWGWKIDPLFQVYQHKDNSKVLYVYKEILGCGYVSEKGGNPVCFVYCVDKLSDIMYRVVPFFEQYPLIGEKYLNFLLFKEICEGLFLGTHRDIFGFKHLVELAFRMNGNGRFRRNSKEHIFSNLEQSSEAKRQTPSLRDEDDIVRSLWRHRGSFAYSEGDNVNVYGSVIPCRVSSDPHEWHNDLSTVSSIDPVKL